MTKAQIRSASGRPLLTVSPYGCSRLGGSHVTLVFDSRSRLSTVYVGGNLNVQTTRGIAPGDGVDAVRDAYPGLRRLRYANDEVGQGADYLVRASHGRSIAFGTVGGEVGYIAAGLNTTADEFCA
jgi:hypothetical protein